MSRIITGLPTSPTRAVTVTTADTAFNRAATARSRAARLLLDSRRQARAILAEAAATATAQAAVEREEARRDGYLAGLQAGRAEVIGALAPLVALIDGAVYEEQASRRTSDVALADLAITLAEAIVCRTIAVEPSTIYAMAQGALTELGRDSSLVTLSVHPTMVAILQEHLPLLDLSEEMTVQVRGDGRLQPTDLTIESGHSRVDARLQTALSRAHAYIQTQFMESLDKDDPLQEVA